MFAYLPLVTKLFGATRVAVDTKLLFAESLVFSRLFLNVETWTAPTRFVIKVLNRAYMRVLRRMCDQCRFKATGNLTDRHVRT
eukprot:1497489-Karenia_brevis.AAC.1